MPEKVTDGEALGHIGEKKALINNSLRRKADWINHILIINCLLHDALEGEIMEAKEVGRRRTQLLDDIGS